MGLRHHLPEAIGSHVGNIRPWPRRGRGTHSDEGAEEDADHGVLSYANRIRHEYER